jgi:type II secretory pathway component PulF
MNKKHKFPVVVQLYLGSGKEAQEMRKELEKVAKDNNMSLSHMIMRILRVNEPDLFKGEQDAN